jgi:hypothetical protein
MENVTDTKDIFNNLFQNPGKLMGLFKNVGDKLEKHMKSGDLKESDLISEATEIMNKMKNMPGMDGIQEMLSKLGMSKDKDVKVNHEAMELSLKRKLKSAQIKERIQTKALLKELQNQSVNQSVNQNVNQKIESIPQFDKEKEEEARRAKITEDELIALFDSAEKPEKTLKNANKTNNTNKNNKKNKNKLKN